MKKLEESHIDEISALKSTYEEKLNLLEYELQKKDSLIEVLTRVSDEKDKVIENLHLYNGERVVTPRALREIKQEISTLKKHLPETTDTLSTLKKDRKKAQSTETLAGKKNTYNIKQSKDLNELKEFVIHPMRSKSVQPYASTQRKEFVNNNSLSAMVSMERLPHLSKRTTK